jgi:hypothetical protein
MVSCWICWGSYHYICFKGHNVFMAATMLNGAAIMDGALLLIASTESCPQPQTSEHLQLLTSWKWSTSSFCKIRFDLIQESVAINQHESIQKFIQVQELDSCFYNWVAVGDESVFLLFATIFLGCVGMRTKMQTKCLTWILWLYLRWLCQGMIADGASCSANFRTAQVQCWCGLWVHCE